MSNDAAANGTSNQKMARQPSVWVSRPPTSGPAALPSPAMPYANPIAWPARAAGKALVSTLTDTGKISAAPRPCTARSAITAPADGATAHNAEATPNIAMPTSSMRLRPKMSPILPAGTMNAPSVSMYTLMTHCRSVAVLPRSCDIRGNARFIAK